MGSNIYGQELSPPSEALDFPYKDKFPTPLHLLSFYDEDIRRGHDDSGKPISVHKWQAEILLELGRTKKITTDKIKVMLLAANGSGKSQYILAPFAAWMALCHKESLTVITTASGEQLDTQALRYITRLCQSINTVHREELGFDIFKCLYREFRCNITKSFIDLFATDEKKKAEGRHPLRPGAEFAIIVDEAKTVDDGIYEALERCKGCSRRIEISSADDCKGYFYNTWKNQKYICYRRKVTAFDCPHIPKEEIDETIVKYGLDSPFVKTSIYSEFASLAESAVITRETLLRCNRLAYNPLQFGELVAGLDLSAGGDETVLDVWSGNLQVGTHIFPLDAYTPNTVTKIIEVIQSYGGRLKPEHINGDDGGVGRGMIDQLNERGYRINRILNNTRAYDSTHFANRGTEMWFTFKRFIEENLVHFLTDSQGLMDSVLFDQLCHRYVTTQDNTKLPRLESKSQAKRNGHPSPDRADAVVLAWSTRFYPLKELEGTVVATVASTDPTILATQIGNKLRESQRNIFLTSPQKVEKNVRDGRYIQANKFGFGYRNIFPVKSNGHY